MLGPRTTKGKGQPSPDNPLTRALKGQQRERAAPTLIDPAEWTRLIQAGNLPDVVVPWLTLQIGLIDALGGAVFEMSAAGPLTLAKQGDIDIDVLSALAANVASSGKATTVRNSTPDEPTSLAQPVIMDKRTVAVVAIAIENPTPARVRSAARGLLWGSAWIREKITVDRAREALDRQQTMAQTHETFAAVLEEDRFRPASLAAVTRLTHVSQSNRVSVGLRRGLRTRIAAVSHSAEFGKRMALNRRVAAAMEEALDQRAALTYPTAPEEVNATKAQEVLAREHGPSAVLSIPFRIAGRHRGAFTFERPADAPFSPEDVARLDFMVAMLGPVLYEKRLNDRLLIWKIFQVLGNQIYKFLGPRHLVRKVVVVALAGLIALFSTWSGTYQVTADAVIEGTVERSIVAPFDGFLRTSPYRAGDTVKAGEIVAALDERDLALERLRWMTEKRQRELEFGRAIGEQARTETEIIRTQIAQADAQINLIDEQLARASITAPFDGVIVTGDQSQNIGGTVQRGDVLFEIAPLDGYRVVMNVDEHRVGDVTTGQAGTLVVTALPNDGYAFNVEKLTPIAIAQDGRNFFRTEATLKDPSQELRPGMSGIAKIAVDERRMIEIWTRALVDWARLTWWKWFG